MQKMTLDAKWTFLTPEKTIDFPKGEHEVTNEIYAAAVADGAVKEKPSGDTAKPGKSVSADDAQG